MTHAHSSKGAAVADELIKQLHAQQPPLYAHLLAAGPSLSGSSLLVRLQDAIVKQNQKRVEDLLLAEVLPPAATLRPTLTYLKSGKDTDRTFRGMVSGNGEYPFDLPELAGFMTQLFETIQKKHPKTEFSERDLFHGHIVAHETNRDIVVVFHAKEYPDQMLNPFQRQRYHDAGLLTGKRSFGSADTMNERNFLWTLRTNQLFVLTDPARTSAKANQDFAALIQRDGDALDFDGKVLGTVYENYFGIERLGVNYFPNHLKDPLFFAPRGGWGVVMHLADKYPKVSWDTIEQIYTATGESLGKTQAELDKLTTTT